MIRSMTGYGRAEARGELAVLTVEARSVNHRYLDIALRLPPALAPLELDARRLVQTRLERGRVDVTVQMTPVPAAPAPEVRLNTSLARRYVDEARALARAVGLSEDGLLPWVLQRPGVVEVTETPQPDPSALWPLLQQALGDALDGLLARRTAEGARLGAELRTLAGELAEQVGVMAERAPCAAARRGERLRERLRALLATAPVDEGRIASEVAVWAQKTDVTEELTRIRAHLDEVRLLLDKGGPVGRPLEFLLQELGRELNTVAAKADDLELSQAVLSARGLLEKMREQVQNLE
jgi:uncharacterized protein (TIGR00255 family)